jgi:hypothetical protein
MSKIFDTVTPQATSNLFKRCILVKLNVSAYTGRKLDKNVSAEIDEQKQTKTKGGNYNKMLFPKCERFKAIGKQINVIREFVNTNTNVFEKGGWRIMKFNRYITFCEEINPMLDKLRQDIDNFTDETNYEESVASSIFLLSNLVTRAEYPSAQEIKRKFRYKLEECPVPDGSFHVQATEEVRQKLESDMIATMTKKLTESMEDVVDRIQDVVHKAIKGLEDEQVPVKTKQGLKFHQTFRDTLLGNIHDICDIGDSLNLTDDPKITKLISDLRQAVNGRDAQMCRDSDSVRHATKRSLEDVVSKYGLGQ